MIRDAGSGKQQEAEIREVGVAEWNLISRAC